MTGGPVPPAHSETSGALFQLSASEITRLVASREVSAAEVLEAHLERIETVNSGLNAVVVRRDDRARRRARELDRDLSRGVAAGPLAGVPFTVKESIHVAGTPSTAGSRAHIPQLAANNSPLIDRMVEGGAILVGKTNLAQVHVFHEGDNPVYGRTNNPWAADRTSGGSSAGEGAIIAAGSVPLGIGSDIGGSVRIPAHFCSVHALKPTANRLSRHNSFDAIAWAGAQAIVAQAGPMARSVTDLASALEVLVVPDAGDISIPPVPLRQPSDVSVRGLRIGWFDDDGAFSPAPAVRRALYEARDLLEDGGAEVVQFTPPDLERAVGLYLGILSSDAARWARGFLAGGPVDRRPQALITLSRLPSPVRAVFARLAQAMGQQGLSRAAASLGGRSAAGYWALVNEAERYRQEFADLLRQRRIDALVCPPHALPALRHGDSYDVSMGGAYALLFNLLGFPAGVISTTAVRPGEETDRPTSRDRAEKVASRVEAGSAGLPVGVQVAAAPWREDIVLAVMGYLEDAVRDRPDYPCRPAAPVRSENDG